MVSPVVVAIALAAIVALVAVALVRTRRADPEETGTAPSGRLLPPGQRGEPPGSVSPAAGGIGSGDLHVLPLHAHDARRFAFLWRRLQVQFVEQPGSAVTEADRLLGEVMDARGYPLGLSDRDDVRWTGPSGVLSDYIAARSVAVRHALGHASVEDLGRAFDHYTSLFDLLLRCDPDGGGAARRSREPSRRSGRLPDPTAPRDPNQVQP